MLFGHKIPQRNMQVYNEIEEKVSSLIETGVATIDLENLISKDVDAYFEMYVEELDAKSRSQRVDSRRYLETDSITFMISLSKKLDRAYNEKARFAFALHLQSTLRTRKRRPHDRSSRLKYDSEKSEIRVSGGDGIYQLLLKRNDTWRFPSMKLALLVCF